MSSRRVLRRRVVAVAVLVAVLVAGYTLWLRNSSLFAIEEVKVTGVTANKAEVTAALQRAAEDMTTLHVRDDELREAVQGFPTVAAISADTSLLHELEVTVTERLPVAEAKLDGQVVPVSADGYVLFGLQDAGELPRIEDADGHGVRLDPDGAAQAAILGATPKELREKVSASAWDETRGGVVVDLEGAPELRFGDGERAEEKWQAVAASLADGVPDVTYIDVSVPDRLATG